MEAVYDIKFTSRGYALTRDDTVIAYYFTPEGAEIALQRVLAKPGARLAVRTIEDPAPTSEVV
jgi:hypothetical protein